MIKSVLITRQSDGRVLCEQNEGYLDEKILTVKHNIKKYHVDVIAYSKTETTSLKCIENPNFLIFYKISNHIVITIIVEKNYPLKLSNSFIDSLFAPFLDEVKCILGANNYQSRLEGINTDHYFVKFDRVIKSKKKEYENPNSARNVDRMKRELQNIQEIMKQNMNLLEGRQKDLEQVEDQARRVTSESKKFLEGTQKLKWHYWIRNNLIWVILVLGVLLLYFLIF